MNWTSTSNYQVAVSNTRLVGAQIGLLIENINKLYGKAMRNNTHLIGHSLGAHVAGFTGSHLKKNGLFLGRITGDNLLSLLLLL